MILTLYDPLNPDQLISYIHVDEDVDVDKERVDYLVMGSTLNNYVLVDQQSFYKTSLARESRTSFLLIKNS